MLPSFERMLPHLVAMCDGLADRDRRHTDTVLVVLDFLGNTDAHADLLSLGGSPVGEL